MTNKLSNQYQEGVIKTLLVNPDALTDVVRIVDENDFDNDNYRLVYHAMLQLSRSESPITPADILAQIGEETPEAHIDPSWLLNLNSDSTPWLLKAPAETWAKLLKKESSRQQVKTLTNQAFQEADTEDPLLLIENLRDNLEDVALSNVIDDSGDRDAMIDDFLEALVEGREEQSRTIHSLYPSVDKYTTGWLPGQLITVGARTGVGKTIFACNSAIAAAAQGKSVMMFSLEMSKKDLLIRLSSSLALVPQQDIENKELEGEDKARFDAAVETLRNYKIDIDDTASVTVDYIRSKAIKKAQSVDGLDMIVVDYLQLITNPNRRNGSRQESVAEISREMKILAKQLGVPVMVLVQLNRESKDDDPDALPKLSDIRESGAIAQDSDIVILIQRRLDDQSANPVAKFVLAKNRKGPAGKIVVARAKMRYATFEDREDAFTENGEEEEVQPMDDYPSNAEDTMAMFAPDEFNSAPEDAFDTSFEEGQF